MTASLQGELNTEIRNWRIESRWGMVFLSEDWSYDRTKSTFEIWMPSKRGTYFEPSLFSQPKGSLNGFTGRVGWGHYTFDNASGKQWTIEAGWQWAFEDSWLVWDGVRIPAIQTFIGLQNGAIKNTGPSSSTNNVNSLAVNSFTLGIRMNLDETY
jgi:hypothetical protein